ncbi:hypothetical protein V496_05506 [Pseudogymnoascus sp. VKM F-4515 (FW-2607)]|nr:hypothetical protein V496_05506 [Pseudogymnoascus sp. VKM F-4515 (FW-2607)]KFY85807.1 hypothetical protein V498_07652 [Pseudogymnoascus sp. VKM F-4517 (FW-2822)]
MAMSHSGVAVVRISRTDLSRNGIPMQQRCGGAAGERGLGRNGRESMQVRITGCDLAWSHETMGELVGDVGIHTMRLSYPAQPSPYPDPSISTKPYSTQRIHKTEFMNLSTLSPPIPDPKLPNPPKDYNSHRGFQAALLRLVRSQAAASTVAPSQKFGVVRNVTARRSGGVRVSPHGAQVAGWLFDVASTRELDGSDLGCGYEACALLVFNLSHGTIVGIVLGIPVGIVLGPVPIENYAMLFGSWP